MASANRNITIECPVCKNEMSSDYWKRHKLKTIIAKANHEDSGILSNQDLVMKF